MAASVLSALTSALLLVLAERSTQSPHGQGNGRIIDANPAALGQFRHQALILSDGKVICSGSLISTAAVLTSAYCTVGYDKFTIRLGGIHRTKNETTAWIVVTRWVVAHPDYKMEGYFSHDVAVVFLPDEAPLNSYISLVTLPSLSEVNETFVGKRSFISGWGKTGDREDPSQTLQYTDVTVIPNSVCELDYKPGFIRESTLCAGNKNKGICSGDHGAPLVLKDSFKQIGIASFYYDKCEVPVPAGYTRVTYFLNWITRTAGIDID